MTKDALLAAVRLSAKIDYITLTTEHRLTKCQLRAFAGKAIHPKSLLGAALTVHDPVREDIERATQLFPNSALTEVEIAIDFRFPAAACSAEHLANLAVLKTELLAKCLKPSLPSPSQGGFRGTYTKLEVGYSLTPFNARVPGPSEQLLYGRRKHPAQTKVYLKRRDQGQELAPKDQCVRMEVRLSGTKLVDHNLFKPADLLGFRYRRELMQYLRHFQGTAMRRKRKGALSPVIEQGHRSIERHHRDFWDRYGVGAFVEGGIASTTKARLVRFKAMNDRIGQALTRLERQFAIKNRVRRGSADAKNANEIKADTSTAASHV